MMDETDFRKVFLTECDELMGQLRDSLATLGDDDLEQLNTAFRAVHSVKGGAAAFGMEELVRFAHIFEDRLAGLRDQGKCPVGAERDLLIRGGDVLELLIERVQDEVQTPLPDWAAATVAQFDGEAAPISELSNASPPQQGEVPDAESETLTLTLRPRPNFFLSGHEPGKLISAAQALGLTDFSIAGDVAKLVDLDPSKCPFEWTLTFDDPDVEALRDFFSVYDLSLDIEGLPGPTLHQPPSSDRHPPVGGSDHIARSNRTLRVELSRIDRIVNLVGEIVIAQAALSQNSTLTLADEATSTVDELSRLIREMQDSVMSIRAQPIKTVFSRMPRVVRDLSETLQREVRLEVEGEQTEVDTTVIEELVEPLTHALRNAMDHGIEPPEERVAKGKPRQGTITLSAKHRGEQVVITVRDDGRGIPRDKVLNSAIDRGLIASAEGLSPEAIDNLVFLPGFSTSSEVSEISGRGVGMDVVKRKITGLGGRCRIESEPGEGLAIILTLPLTLAVLDGMVVRICGERFVIPLTGVVEAVRIRPSDVETMPDGSWILARRGQHLPLFDLGTLLGLGPSSGGLGLIVDTESHGPVVVLVDLLLGQRQVVLKSVETNYQHVRGVSGATILGDGLVALILDVTALIFERVEPGASHGLEEVA
ncbi:chemotaxis protein CheA [Pontivivens insulae]|uniref:Chemotaxis protein CheA n=1 Tax=Pontivivens insulae TaxID=1639689 RepID=A0A2R8A768_9RHOB|nr:chemotaxis protein CheA [Pontivivens insulae]RED17971.1 two-component system chemotaxis sensor kinase CheA [Pontivivens insulae]SPF27860.1 Chemotaxis protein CheA [Pontivivens insulae]